MAVDGVEKSKGGERKSSEGLHGEGCSQDTVGLLWLQPLAVVLLPLYIYLHKPTQP